MCYERGGVCVGRRQVHSYNEGARECGDDSKSAAQEQRHCHHCQTGKCALVNVGVSGKR